MLSLECSCPIKVSKAFPLQSFMGSLGMPCPDPEDSEGFQKRKIAKEGS